MSNPETSFEKFADRFDRAMGEFGDYSHRKTIDIALFRAVGNFADKTIYDVGCGNGHVARKFAREGARKILASDISPSLIEKAINYGTFEDKIKYITCDFTDTSRIPSNSINLITINMAIQYIKDLPIFLDKMRDILDNNGRLIFTVMHPLGKIATLDAQGANILTNDHMDILRNYLTKTNRKAKNSWFDNYDLNISEAPIEYYLSSLISKNFLIDSFVEQPTDIIIRNNPFSDPVKSSIPFVYAVGAKKCINRAN